ncbi:MAG: hypothetical protein WBW79_06090, partial [Desulfocapsaceae bacterium]
MKRTLKLSAVICLTLLTYLFSIACATDGHCADETSPGLSKGQKFLVLFSGNVRGELEPCGCGSKRLGGLSEKYYQISRITDNPSIPAILVDSGNLLYKNSKSSTGNESADIIAEAIAAAYSAM